MKQWIHALCLLLSASALAADSGFSDSSPVRKAPNIIVILLDDLGLHDTGFMGNDFIETPAIDRLAHDGMVFTQAYATAPNCAPSRAAIMSGQYAQRTGVYTMVSGDTGEPSQRQLLTPRNNMFLPEKVHTLAEMLRDSGYATAHIGKWNLGHGAIRGPEGQGFDVNIGGHRGGVGDSYYAPYSNNLPGLQAAPAGEYLTDRLNSEAVKFVQANSKKPFFLYLSHYAPHFPIQAPSRTVKKYETKRDRLCKPPTALQYCDMTQYYPEYAAMVEHIDDGVAQLRAALETAGIADNTVIVLLSDNGGYSWVRDPHALRGRKSQLYEGGIRVPMVWLLPGQPAGVKNNTPVSGIDIYPTLAALAGVDTSQETLDGMNIAPLLTGGMLPSRSLYWYFPAYTQDTETDETIGPEKLDVSGKPDVPGKQSAVNSESSRHFFQIPATVVLRDGWKLIRYYSSSHPASSQHSSLQQGNDHPPELYYLPDDPLEKNNRFSTEKKRGRDMMNELERWLESTGAPLTLPANPAYRHPAANEGSGG